MGPQSGPAKRIMINFDQFYVTDGTSQMAIRDKGIRSASD